MLTAGDLDSTFGVGGHVETEYATSTEASRAFASVVQSDGKIIAAWEGGIARSLPNGSLDTTFGVGGQVQYPYFTRSIALQTNGSFVVAGATSSVGNPRFVVSRYSSNGTIDTTFDSDGHAQLSFGGTSEYATDIAVQANGRLVVVGVSDSQIAVARLTAAGALDTTFSGDGLLLKTIYTTRNEASAVAIQPDGKIVVAGSTWSYSYSASIHDLFVLRLNPGGGMDASFDTDGVATIVGGRQAVGRDLTLLSSGQIVVSGWLDASFQSNVVVGKFNADGSRDMTFGFEGRTSTQLSSSTSDRTGGEAHVVLADGSIVVSAGTRLIKFGANRVQDTSASKSVIATTIRDMISPPGGRLFLAGSVSSLFGTAMLKADRTLDSTWSGDGLAPVEFGNSDDIAGRSVQQTNGGYFSMLRYLSNGTLDSSFSGDGMLTTFDANVTSSILNNLVIQPDGKMLVAGEIQPFMSGRYPTSLLIARFNSNGTLDTTFGTNGRVITSSMQQRTDDLLWSARSVQTAAVEAICF